MATATVSATTGGQITPGSSPYTPGGTVGAPANPLAMPSTNGQYTSPYAGQTINGSNAPVMPGFNIPWNPSMAEAPQLQSELSGVTYDQQPLQNLANYASNPNESPWAQASQMQSYLQQQQAENQEQGNAAGAEAQANGNLALQGGLSSGARERVAETGQQSLMGGEQNIASQGQNNRSQININDAANKLQAQEQLPGLETQSYEAQLEPVQMEAQAQAQDIANQMNATNALNAFNMQAFNTQGQMYGAQQQSNATMDAPQPSCWLITELTKHGMKVAPDEAQLLEKLKAYTGKKYAAYSIFYINRCGELIRRMNLRQFDWKQFTWFNTALVSLMRAGELEAASRLFISTLTDLVKVFWPECAHFAYRRMCADSLKKRGYAANLKLTEALPKALRGRCLTNLPKEAFA